MKSIDSAINIPDTTGLAASLRGVAKSYPHFQLQPTDLDLPLGTVMGLIGSNGAGKSTTMRIMMGLVHPDRGTVSMLGNPISSTLVSSKQHIGYFAEDMRLYKPETIGWHMQLVASLYPAWDKPYAQLMLDRFGLIDSQLIKGLSHGQRVKAMLLLLLARRPRLLILDEPTNGLDPVAKQEVLTELMRAVQEEDRTILYSSHNTQDVEQISDTITFIDRGRVIASSERDAFLDRWRTIKLNVPTDWQAPSISGLKLESSFRSLQVYSHSQYSCECLNRLQNSGAQVESVEPMSLEEIFVNLVMRGRAGVQI